MSLDDLVRMYLELTSEGVLVWRLSPSRKIKAGSVAGNLRADGYVGIKLKGHRLLAHRCVVFLTTGEWPRMVDHIKGKGNNPSNLRGCTPSDNQHNRGAQRNSKSGVKGLSLRRGSWVGQVKHKGVVYSKQDKDPAVVQAWLLETRAMLAKEFAHD